MPKSQRPTSTADTAAALLAFDGPSFGEAIYEVRRRRGQAQAMTAAAARLSAGYYSELENGKRLAPPRQTALRIAKALRMSELETNHLVSLADAERAAALQDAHLPPKVRQLMATIRAVAANLPADFVDAMQARFREVSM
jgi:transcriptional regulator with XRE-family HTH domain